MKKINMHVFLGLFAIMMMAAPAYADKSNPSTIGQYSGTPTVNIMLGKAEMIDVGGEVADVLVANPSVADVMAVKSNRLYIVGSALGDTNIMALDRAGNIIRKINVHVQIDVEKISTMIKELYPMEDVRIRALTDQVILTGDVSTPAVSNAISNLVGNYAGEIQGMEGRAIDDIIVNMLGVQGQQQVMLRVKIVEASRSALKDLGLEANSVGGGGVGDLAATLGTAAGLGLASPVQLGVAALNYSSGDFGNLSFIGRALEQEGILNTLAEPNLTAISGEQAGFLAGGEFPIPTALDQNGNLIYEFKPFGVSLNFKPIVMSKNRISLQLNTEVSTTSFDQNLQLNGINVPTFNVRRADTTVELPSGGTLMIAGLIQSNSISGLSQLPGIGDIPVVGDLVKSDSFRRNESEVIVMITPYLVEPFAQNQATFETSKTNTVLEKQLKAQGAFIDESDLMDETHMIDEADIMGDMPLREENKLQTVFSKNINRLYGNKAPSTMMNQTLGFGYMTE